MVLSDLQEMELLRRSVFLNGYFGALYPGQFKRTEVVDF